MDPSRDEAAPARPGVARRAAAGAWQVPAGFAFLLGHPRLWPLAALPALAALALFGLGALAGLLLAARLEGAFLPEPGRLPEWAALPMTALLWIATIGAGAFLGLGVALALAAPLLEALSRRVEERARGIAEDASPGLVFELKQSLLCGARAVAAQMTDPALTRRGLGFAEKRRWHRVWRAESLGFGLAGMLCFVVPLANLLIAPALVAGGTLLVLELEDAAGPRPVAARPSEARAATREPGAGGTDAG
jgi:uncharacterized protein involved in cysteine biosynthesis